MIYESYLQEVDLPNQIEHERLTNLVERLRGGDDTVKAEIVAGHIRLASSIITKYAAWQRHKTDDLLGASLLGLCQAVEWARERLTDNNITPYIYATCERFVRDQIEHSHIVRIPRSSYNRMKKEKEDQLFVPIVQSVESFRHDEDNYDDPYDHLLEVIPCTTDEHTFIFIELLNSLELDSRERIIVDMLMASYTLEDISKTVGVSIQYVSRLKNRIGERLLRRGA